VTTATGSLLGIRTRPHTAASIRAVSTTLVLGVVCLSMGLLVATHAQVTTAIGAAVLLAALAIAVPQLTVPSLFIAPLVVAQISGLGGVVMLLASLAIFGLTQRTISHPFVLVGVPIALYTILGGANISSYRGTIDDATLRLVLVDVIILLVGVAATGGTRSRRTRLTLARPIAPDILLLGFLPGLVGLALIISRAGIPLLHPSTRTSVGGLALLLGESALAGLALYCCNVFARRAPRRGDLMVMGSVVFALALSGYRGWPILGLLLVVICGVYFRRFRVTCLRACLVMGAVLTIVAGGEFVRRDTGSGSLLSTQQLASRYGAESIPPGVRELHLDFREVIALTQLLIRDREHGRRPTQSLLLADFETMLHPGQKYPSGGTLVGQIVGDQGRAGITAGAVGVSFMELGYASVLVFLCLGLLIGTSWRMATRSAQSAVFYFLVVIYAIHFFHRGVPKPSYLVIPLLYLLLVSTPLLAARTRRRPTGSVRPSQSKGPSPASPCEQVLGRGLSAPSKRFTRRAPQIGG
jgi:hypothetical protein